MILEDVREILEAEVIVGNDLMNKDVVMVCGSDLMSDVLAFVKQGALLLTGLTNPQVVRTAEMADIAAIVFVRGKMPDPDTVALTKEKGIPLVASPYTMFEMCGRLFEAGMASCDIST